MKGLLEYLANVFTGGRAWRRRSRELAMMLAHAN
jgi:hypothetical protein